MEFVAFDLETTGTRLSEHRIVELGAVRFEGGKALEGFVHLINPQVPIPPDASAVNGITDEMVKGKPHIEQVLGEFSEFCRDLPLVAHNAPFDYKFLLADVKRYERPAPRGTVLDTLPLARRIFPGLPDYKLWTLVRHLNFPGGTFHRAEKDSFYCGLLFAKQVEILEMRNEPCSVEALQQMMDRKPMEFPQFVQKSKQMNMF